MISWSIAHCKPYLDTQNVNDLLKILRKCIIINAIDKYHIIQKLLWVIQFQWQVDYRSSILGSSTLECVKTDIEMLCKLDKIYLASVRVKVQGILQESI